MFEIFDSYFQAVGTHHMVASMTIEPAGYGNIHLLVVIFRVELNQVIGAGYIVGQALSQDLGWV